MIDIDGVLNYYPEPWLSFLNNKLNTKHTSVYNAKSNVSYLQYTTIRDTYRISSEKATMKVRDGAREFLDTLKERGYRITITTTRPYFEYPFMEKMTKNWLDSNKLPYHDLKFVRHETIYCGGFIVEDELETANTVPCKTVFLLDKPYNQGETSNSVIRVESLEEILKLIK